MLLVLRSRLPGCVDALLGFLLGEDSELDLLLDCHLLRPLDSVRVQVHVLLTFRRDDQVVVACLRARRHTGFRSQPQPTLLKFAASLPNQYWPIELVDDHVVRDHSDDGRLVEGRRRCFDGNAYL